MTDEEYTVIREWILRLDRKEITINELLTCMHRFHFEGEKKEPNDTTIAASFSAAHRYRTDPE